MSKWEPIGSDNVIPTGAPDSDGRDTHVVIEYDAELWGDKQSLLIRTFDGDGEYYASIVLPKGVRLCCLVDAPEVRTAQEVADDTPN